MEEEPRRRRRPALSCLACRRRKIKCDRSNPCARCVSTGTICRYRIGVSPAGDARTVTPIESQRAAVLSPGVSHLAPARAAINGNTTIPRHEHNSLTLGQNGHTPHPLAPHVERLTRTGHNETPAPTPLLEASDLRDLRQRVCNLEELSASSPVNGLSETGRHILARQAGLRNSEIMLKKTRLLRWSDWMGTSPEAGSSLTELRHIADHL